jgi:hypothetical protein
MVSGYSNTAANGVPLPAALPQAPGCELLVSPDGVDLVATTAAGAATQPITLPNASSLAGLNLFHQYVVVDGPANPLGIIVSNGVRAIVGN